MVWMLVGNQLVMEGMSEWEVWNVKVNVMEGYKGAVCKVVKYPSQSKFVANCKDPKLKVGDIVNNVLATTDIMDKSPYLQLLTVQEDNLRRLVEVLKGEDDGVDKDREARARCWTRERGLAEISIKREEREKLELILAVDRELGDF